MCPALRIGIRQRTNRFDDTGVVDEDIDLTKRLASKLHHRDNIAVVTDVTTNGNGVFPAATYFRYQVFERIHGSGCGDNIDAKTGQLQCRGRANTTACAGNYGDLTG